VVSSEEKSPEEPISYTNKKGANCAFFVNLLYSLCYMLYSFNDSLTVD